MLDVLIIGCGITGAAVAYELSKYQFKTAILEAENDVSTGTTKANSAILHAGYDPKPGTLMAKLNVEGVRLAKELCQKLDVPYKQTGSLVLAFNETEKEHLNKLYQNGVENGVNVQLLSKDEVLAKEPNISHEVVAALYASEAAIVSPWEYALALAQVAVQNGVELYLNSKVTNIERSQTGYRVYCGDIFYDTKYIVNAAGVFASDIASNIAKPDFIDAPSIGEYYLLDKQEGKRVSSVVFQCPNENGKGVLVAPTVHGNLIVGPNAAPCEKTDAYTTSEGLSFVARMAKKSVPEVDLRASIRNFSGVRANTNIDDFIIEFTSQNFLSLAGIKSPGLSAAPAIAKYAVSLLAESGLVLTENSSFIAQRQRIKFKELSAQQKAELIKKNPSYGRVICRCETVTEGEILQTMKEPIPPASLDGVKRRVGAGMGRCQGGFCGPRVLELLSKNLNISEIDVLQDKQGTYILTGDTKGGEC